MNSLLQERINLKIDTDIREKTFAFKWIVQDILQIPGSVQSMRFSLLGDQTLDWYATVTGLGHNKFKVSLTCDSAEPIPLRIEHVSTAFDSKLKKLGGSSPAGPLFFQQRGEECVLLDKVECPEGKAIFECSMKIYGFDLNTTCDESNLGDETDIDLEEYKEGLRKLMDDKAHADLKVIAVGRYFIVHKCVLKIRVPKFFEIHKEDILSGEVTINSIEGDIFQSFLEFVYVGEEGVLPKKDDYRKLYKVAHRYALAGLQRRCGKALSKELRADSVVDIFLLANDHDDEQLKMQCRVFMRRNLDEMKNILKWKNLVKCNINIEEEVSKIHC